MDGGDVPSEGLNTSYDEKNKNDLSSDQCLARAIFIGRQRLESTLISIGKNAIMIRNSLINALTD